MVLVAMSSLTLINLVNSFSTTFLLPTLHSESKKEKKKEAIRLLWSVNHHICCCDFQSGQIRISYIIHTGAEVVSPYVKQSQYSYLHWHVVDLFSTWRCLLEGSSCKCDTANMDVFILHQCWDNASWSKCPHQSEVLQNNYLHQDLIWCLYIKALKATFDRTLHLLKDQTGDQSSHQLLSITTLFLSESR